MPRSRAVTATAAVRNPGGGDRGAAELPHVAGKVANAGLPGATSTARAGSYGKVASAGIPGVIKATATRENSCSASPRRDTSQVNRVE